MSLALGTSFARLNAGSASVKRMFRGSAGVWNADAADWIKRVEANSGSVSTATANAVTNFCNAIDAAGIRDKFYRLNLFCGTGLNACLVPLYRGPSLSGTQYGNATDTNNGPFVSGDYVETTGLGSVGNATKYLDTGFATDTLSATSRHLAFYDITPAGRTYDTAIGSEAPSAPNAMLFAIGSGPTTTTLVFAAFNTISDFCFATLSGAKMIVGTTSGASGTESALYFDGSQADTGSGTVATPPSSNIFVMALNRASAPGATEHYGGRVGGYSIGLQMSQGAAEAYSTAMTAFQTALGRNV